MNLAWLEIFRRLHTHDDGFLLLPEPLLAQEDDCGLEHEAHCMQLQPLFDLAQEVGNVEPLYPAVVEQVAGAKVDRLL